MNPFLDFFKVKVFTSSHSSNTEKEKGKKKGEKKGGSSHLNPHMEPFHPNTPENFHKSRTFFFRGVEIRGFIYRRTHFVGAHRSITIENLPFFNGYVGDFFFFFFMYIQFNPLTLTKPKFKK